MDTILKLIENMQTELSADYTLRSVCVSLFFGLAFFAIFLFIALKQRQSRILGIVTAVMQLVASLCTSWLVISFHKSDLYFVVNEMGSSDRNVFEIIVDILGLGVFKMYLSMIPTLTAALICIICWACAFFYMNAIKLDCQRHTANISIVVHIIRLILVWPIPLFFMFTDSGVTEALQCKYDIVFNIISLVPYLLLLLALCIGNKQSFKNPYDDFEFNQEEHNDDNVVITVEGEERV